MTSEAAIARESSVNPINAIGTSDRRASLRSREAEIGRSQNERLSVFDGNGREIFRNDNGEKDRIEVPDNIPQKDMVITHNHPNGNSFSVGDMVAAVEKNLKELRAVYKDTVFSLKRPEGGWNVTADEIRSAYSSAMMDIIHKDSSYQRRGDTAFTRSMLTMNRRMVRQIAKELGLRYTKSKIK